MTADTERERAEQVCADGELALRRHEGAAAEKQFHEALALVEGDDCDAALRVAARAHTGAGRVRLAAGELDAAVAEFERARSLRPHAAGPLHWLGCAAAHAGDLTTAETHLTAALACAVPHPRTLIQRAYVHARAGRPDAARADLLTASRTAPLDEEAHWALAALSGRPAREVALRLRAAAVARAGAEAAKGAAGRPPRDAGTACGGDRAAALLETAWDLDREPGGFAPLYAALLVRSEEDREGGRDDGSESGDRRRGPARGARRGVAVDLLREAVRRAPTDHRVTHSLAIALLNSQDDERSSHWEPCVAAWAALLYDEGFWERVRVTAARRYGVPVERALVPVLRAGLRELLERRMPDADIGTRVAPGPLLQREADAAKLLAGVGGLPSAEPAEGTESGGGGGEPLFCGPLRIAELGRTAEFGAFAAAQEERLLQESVAASANGAAGAGAAAAPPTHTSLTYAFSELGFAQLLLGQNKPADALAALTELRCPGCRKRGGPGSGAVCEPDCARFDELNPGYAGLPDRHHRLALDARGLALEARLSMGRAELIAARPDFGAAAAYWRRALVHSRELERYRETQTAIVDMALGAARDAHRVGRLSLAVDTLETTRSVIGANERGRLEGQLARVLADRGISVANDETSLLDEPAADLRRSVAFNPHLLRAQVSLGIVLRGLASARWSSGSLSGARDTLREAIDQLTAALVHFPADPDLEEQREAAVADLDHVMWQPDESGR
ncbi:hypothetical protein [Streptomyces formicae]|uniref:Uncharacterized protein n=1 Tax=Streptomyces formicae TaxID=1616117 RepID=A0A291QII1_9ACTN|nr:hypothetical protein [Streptomyces formicae]ATL31316.1 hypothetical protein KY5_6298c [Streptomyces formicae]